MSYGIENPSANSEIFTEAERKKRQGRETQKPPDEIDHLDRFADDMLGYGYDELVPGGVVDFENSALGTDEAKRKAKFRSGFARENAMASAAVQGPAIRTVVNSYRRDIRSYTYKESESKWIPHKRQSKKVADEMIDDGQ